MTSTKQPIRGVQTCFKTMNPESNHPPSPESNNQNQNMKELFTEISKMNAILQWVATDVITIKATTTELKDTISSIHARLSEVENHISHVKDVSNCLIDDTKKEWEKRWTNSGIKVRIWKITADGG